MAGKAVVRGERSRAAAVDMNAGVTKSNVIAAAAAIRDGVVLVLACCVFMKIVSNNKTNKGRGIRYKAKYINPRLLPSNFSEGKV